MGSSPLSERDASRYDSDRKFAKRLVLSPSFPTTSSGCPQLSHEMRQMHPTTTNNPIPQIPTSQKFGLRIMTWISRSIDSEQMIYIARLCFPFKEFLNTIRLSLLCFQSIRSFWSFRHNGSNSRWIHRWCGCLCCHWNLPLCKSNRKCVLVLSNCMK